MSEIESAIAKTHSNTLPLPAFEPSRTKLLKIKDVCDRLNITRQTLHKIIKQGSLKSVRLSTRNIRISEYSLNEFITNSQNKGE